MRRPTRLLALLLAAITLGPPAATRAEEVENPTYRSWARVPPGTRVTVRAITERDGHSIETTTTYTLVEINPKNALVDMVVVSNATGTTVTNPPQRLEYRRMFPLLPGMKREQIGRPSGVVASGAEEITVAGRAYRAEWYDSKSTTEAGEALTRTWICDAVPGKVLRSVTRVPAGPKTTTLELVEVKAP